MGLTKSHGYLDKDDPPLKEPVVMPWNAPSIPQGYHPSGNNFAGHLGIDIIGPRNTSVIAVDSGTIMTTKWDLLYGYQVVIRHNVKHEGKFVISRYLHLNARVVEAGDEVKRGQEIGTLGSTGFLATYPHLHFELGFAKTKKQHFFITENPHKYWYDGVGKISCFDKTKEYKKKTLGITYPLLCQ